MAKTPAQRAAKHGDRATPGVPGVPVQAANPSTQRSPAKAKSNANLILIAGVVASAFLFWYFHLLTLNQMTQLSNGLAMPDSMAFGFDTGDITRLKAAMNADALGQLQYVHKTAGTLFPLVFGFSWLLLIGLNVGRRALRWALWAAPVLFAVVQLVANVLIDAMLAASPVDPAQVAWASSLTMISWALLVISLLAAVFAFSPWGKRKGPAKPPGQ
ncbi:hypothetical protein [Psychromicrobium sp. YIM B11713]|uniref:hypothetical protein n=1 Tax=Psychromicrobium sp. YIM B11713 TaxID=3145233 RepID=UPI00374FABF2